ncbi:hypothetical protein OPV22_010540 [Ensete ventricosum]|uniref:GYF domain-containing protein n=1 Tax=Ensete ventricosum TaxID=4639 RepID=A0AAV8R7N4_ENSVE|nr:hypothetical protein OPV22_010540 [Ensete ventricosum]
MAGGNVNLPEDLLPSKLADEAWAGKDTLIGGNGKEIPLMGFLDKGEDQVTSENSIPLSPQWLYAKPSDNKETRSPSLAPSVTLPDFVQNDMRRLDGSLDKKEWRRNANDLESNRRWRDEERETGLLGRRERKKEGDRDTEYRKNDHHPDNISIREALDLRTLSSSDWLHEISNRSAGNESRRDNKWSSRWGPEDKDKEPQREKKVDVDKEGSHAEKQSFIANLRPLSGSDSHDKWRPRHRQEIHSSGSSVLRAAPGFGLERDRVEGPPVPFASGRGRSKSVTVLQFGRPSAAGPIGAAPINKEQFRYPRGKLLDIYRNQKMSVVDAIPEGFEEVPLVTGSSSLTPLAFVAPDVDEEVLLKDIWKGKVTSSELSLSKERAVIINETELDGGKTIVEKKHDEKESFTTSRDLDMDCKSEDNPDIRINLVVGPVGLAPVVVDHDVVYDKPVSDGDILSSEINVGKIELVNVDGRSCLSDILKNIKLEGEDSTVSLDVSAKLPDESYPLFDASFEIPNTSKHEISKIEKKHLEQGTSLEELSLLYQDPQGDIQGPFLVVDIISWFEQGFFGTDLLVCLSDAPEGTPFQPLGEIMPHMKLETHTISDAPSAENVEAVETTRGDLDACVPLFQSSGSFITNGQQQVLSWDALGHHMQPNVVESEASVNPNKERLSFSISEAPLGTACVDRKIFHDFAGQDAEVVSFNGRPMSDMEVSGKLVNDHIALSSSTSGHQFMVADTGNTSVSSHKIPRDNDFNPLGLLWSELEATHRKHPLSSTIPFSSEIDNHDSARNAFLFSHNQEQFNLTSDYPVAKESRANNCKGLNIIHDTIDANNLSRFEAESNQLNLEQQLLFQQLQKQQLEEQRLLAHQDVEFAGTFFNQMHGSVHQHHLVNQRSMEDLECILKYQFEQQRLLDQLQQQHQLHQRQQQLQEHQMRLLQHHLQFHEPQQPQKQIHLEHLLHQHLLEPGSGASNIDSHLMNMFEQVLLRQHLLNESHQQSHNLPLHHDATIEQLLQANVSRSLQRHNHNDLLDVLSHSKQRQVPPSEQQFLLRLQREQLQGRKYSTVSRKLPGMEGERHVGGVWSVDGSGQFIRTAASPHQNHSARFSQLDILRTPQSLSSPEQPSQLHRNFPSHERMQQGPYERGPHPIDKSMHMHAVTPNSNLKFLNAIARAQGPDGQGLLDHFHTPGQIGQFPSSAHPHQSEIFEFTGTHLDAAEKHWSEPSRQQPADLMQSHLKQLLLEAEKQRRGTNMIEDPNAWTSYAENDGNSEYGFRDLFHQEIPQSQHTKGLVVATATASYEQRDSSWIYSQPVFEHSFKLGPDRAGLNSSLSEGSLFAQVGQPPNEQLVNNNLEDGVNNFENSRSTLRSNSTTSLEQKHFQSDMDLIERDKFVNYVGGASLQWLGFSNLVEGERGKMQGLKGSSGTQSAMETHESGVMQFEGGGHEEAHIDKPSRHDSSGKAGGDLVFYKYETGLDSANLEETNNMISGDLPKGTDKSISKHACDLLATSPITVSDLISSRPPKRRNPITSGSSEVHTEGKRESAGDLVNQSIETSISNKKDLRFCQTSSGNNADVIEPSFSEMLKSTKKPMPELETLEAGSIGKGPKKRGKKGRQIDPSLLGFKVHSNRILMGEIQRPDD